MTIVRCPKCSSRLQLPPSSESGVCPRCRTRVSAATASVVPASPPTTRQASGTPPVAAKPTAPVALSSPPLAHSVTKLGFFAYFREHFATTHWPAVFGICCGLFSIPAVSFLKPVLGFRGMCFVLAGAVALAVASSVIYAIQRFTAYFLRGERSVPIQAKSWTARLAYGGWMFLIPMTTWVGTEYFTSPYGLLATIAPDLRKEQVRWLRLPISEGDHQDSGSVVSSDKEVPKNENTRAPEVSSPVQVESENPFVVVEDASASKQSPKGVAPSNADKADENPFQVVEEGSR
jgi:hypothetical protein